VHPNVAKLITIPGKAGSDAKQYLIKAVELAVEDSKNESK
jgi:predicted RNA binding protein YcfA (HicA-like mRNA interferase family)